MHEEGGHARQEHVVGVVAATDGLATGHQLEIGVNGEAEAWKGEMGEWKNANQSNHDINIKRWA
jgi:hypothetical protein